MFKVRNIFRLAVFVLYVGLLVPGAAQAAVVDDIFEAIVENGFRKVGKNLDDIADLRRAGDSFSTVLRNNDDILNAASVARRVPVDDDIINLRKINFPTGSRFGDDLMTLSKNHRLLAYALDDTVSRVARLPHGEDIIRVTGAQGLLIGATYGDEALETTYQLARQGNVLDIANDSIRNIDENTIRIIDETKALAGPIDVPALRRAGDINAVKTSENILKKYGIRGLHSMRQLFDWAIRHPKSAIAGVVVAAACVKPEVIIDSAGYLSRNALYALSETTAVITSEVAAVTVRTPFMTISRTIEKLLPWLPLSLRYVLTGVIAVFFVLCILLCTPLRSFVKKFFAWIWIKSGLKSIFQRIRTRGKITKPNASESSDVVRL